jgi:hypothetical protein
LNRVLGFLETVGKDFKKGLDVLLTNRYAVAAENVTFGVLFPGLGPVFHATVSAIVTAEQGAAALGKQNGSGPTKFAAVLQLMEPLVAQALADAGKPNDTAAVTAYINSVVNVLNLAPPPEPAPAPPAA